MSTKESDLISELSVLFPLILKDHLKMIVRAYSALIAKHLKEENNVKIFGLGTLAPLKKGRRKVHLFGGRMVEYDANTVKFKPSTKLIQGLK